jgi:hypothetical protein
MRRIGVFIDLAEGDPEGQARVAALKRGLHDLGWIEGRNLRIEPRWAAGEAARMRPLAEELVSLAPEVIVSSGAPTLAALQQATRTIPLVFGQVAEPVAAGFVDSLSRPGGNITGFTSFEYAMGGKWLGTLKEIAPSIVRVAVLRDPGSGVGAIGMLGAIQAVMPNFAMPLTIASGRDAAEFERVIDAFANEPNGGLIVMPAGDHFSLMLRHSCQNVNCKLIGVRIVYGHEFNTAVHQRSDKRQIATQPVELGNDESRFLLFAGRERCGELRAVSVLAAFNLGEFRNHRPAAAVEMFKTASRWASSPRPDLPCRSVDTRK